MRTPGGQVAGDEGELGLEGGDIGLDGREGLGALGVAGAEPAEALAEGDVEVDRNRDRGSSAARQSAWKAGPTVGAKFGAVG